MRRPSAAVRLFDTAAILPALPALPAEETPTVVPAKAPVWRPPTSRDDTHLLDKEEPHLLRVLERLDCGYVVIDARKKIITANAAARRLLDRENEGEPASLARRQIVLQNLVERGRGRLTLGALTWLAVSRENGVTFSVVQAINTASDNLGVVILLDMDAPLAPNPDTLKRLFGLTLTEARLAVQLAKGQTPDEVAKSRRVSRTTVRTQLGSIFAKTNTKRQAALVSLLARVALLP